MPDLPLIEAARQWVITTYTYNSHHLVKALEWLDRLAPDATEAMRLATLTHDMERAFPGPDQPVQEKIDGLWRDDEYNTAHSTRSAKFVGEWLHTQNASEELIHEVERLITAHEIGGWTEANLVQAADSLSFLETNIDLFLNMARSGKRLLDEVAIKFFTIYERIQIPQAREVALPLYEAAMERVRQLPNDTPVGAYNDLTHMLLTKAPNEAIYTLAWEVRPVTKLVEAYADALERHVLGQQNLTEIELRRLGSSLKRHAHRAVEMNWSLFHFLQLQERYRPQKDKQH